MNLPSMHDSLAVKMPDPNMAFTTVHCVYVPYCIFHLQRHNNIQIVNIVYIP